MNPDNEIALRIGDLHLRHDVYAKLQSVLEHGLKGKQVGGIKAKLRLNTNIPVSELPIAVECLSDAIRAVKVDDVEEGGFRNALSTLGALFGTIPELVRALWCVYSEAVSNQEKLSSAYSEFVGFVRGLDFTFPDNGCLDNAFESQSLQTLAKAIDAQSVGIHRVLFPVVSLDAKVNEDTHKQTGSQQHNPSFLLKAKINVVRASSEDKEWIQRHANETTLHAHQSESHQFLLTPWTRFFPADQPDENGRRAYSNLRDSLPEVLKYQLGIAESKLIFWVQFDTLPAHDFMPDQLSDDDRKKYELTANTNMDDVRRTFCPPRFEFDGPSMGLAVGIAAFAAIKQSAIRPIIATGAIESDGEIGGVQHYRDKFRVIKHFRYFAANPRIRTAIPVMSNASLDEQTDGKEVGAVRLAKVEDFSEQLTDGFDDVRNLLRDPIGKGSPVEQFGQSSHLNEEVLKAGYSQLDLHKAQRMYEELTGMLNGEVRDDDARKVIAVPFGEEPIVVAAWMIKEVAAHLWKEEASQNDRESWEARPIILPVCLSTLADAAATAEGAIRDEDWLRHLSKAGTAGIRALRSAAGISQDTRTTLELCLFESLRIARNRTVPCLNDDAAHEIAIGKLVVVAFEEPSHLTPFGNEKEMEQRLNAIRGLRKFLTGDQEGRNESGDCARHQIRLVVPDAHYQHWLESKLTGFQNPVAPINSGA